MKVLAVTGTRADWGLLAPVLALLRDDARFDLAICATGQHLMGDRASLAAIEAEGFAVDATVDMELSEDDGPRALSAAMGRALTGIGAVLDDAKPDLVLILGDRYETLAAASASVLSRVPVAHLCGGDLTLGAMDDAFRHAITKLSALHFPTNADAARRIARMGEDPARIHAVGSPGIDRLHAMEPTGRRAFLKGLGLPDAPFAVVTFHPPTLSGDGAAHCAEMLAALDDTGLALLLTGSNADPGGRGIDRMLRDFAEGRDRAVYRESLGSRGYADALRHAEVCVGNSSSGLYEAPSFGLPVVNIGDRQEGRLRAACVIDCAPERGAIAGAIATARARGRAPCDTPYGDGRAAPRIVKVLAATDPAALIRKGFNEGMA